VIHFDPRRIGHELARDVELVLGQLVDEMLACRDACRPFEQQLQPVPRPGEGDAGPGVLMMAGDPRLSAGKPLQRLAQAVGRRAPPVRAGGGLTECPGKGLRFNVHGVPPCRCS